MRSSHWLKISAFGVLSLSLAVGAFVLPTALAQEEGAKPKHTIKEVMAANKPNQLLSKVIKGEASADEKKELLDLFVSLVENKPKKGDMESWHTLAGGAALAAAKVVVGREGAEKELEAATNCKACHSVHK